MSRPLWLALALAACTGGGDDTGDPAPADANTVTLTFAATEGVRTSGALVDPLAGEVHGSIYRLAQVGVTGPRDGAEDVAGVDLEIDLREVDVSAASFTTDPLPADTYVFLGFLDVDGSDPSGPDAGDPVTLATTNDFTVVEGEATEVTVNFELVFN